MKPTVKSTIAIAAAALALAACTTKESNNGSTLSFSRLQDEQSYRLVGSAADHDSENDISYGCQVDMLMPEVLYGKPVDVLRDTIMNIAFGSSGPDTKAIIASAMHKAAEEIGYEVTDSVLPDSVIAAEPEFLCRYDGFTSIEGDVETLTPRLLSYAVTSSNYTYGAAHGMYGTRYVNYDMLTGRVVTLADLFTSEGLEALPGIIRDAATTMESTIGSTDIETLPADGNFYITAAHEIVFAYQPYEVASYAQGEIQIPMAAYMLSQYLTDEGNELLLKR